MSEEEMYESDLHTIYRLIDIHASFNNPKTSKNDKKEKQKEDDGDVYIDNIVF